MRVVIADKLPESAHLTLKSGGCEVFYDPSLKGDELGRVLSETGAQALIVRSTKVSEAILNVSPSLGLIVRAGAGVNTIAVEKAAARGVYVANCPGMNAQAVVELAFGLILAADRQIPNNVRDLRAGRWRKKHYGKARGLYGRTLGLLGLGSIGRAMIGPAQALGMQVVAWSRSLSEGDAQELGIEAMAGPVEVASRADVLSVHLALNDSTRGFVGEAILGALRPGSIFINTSRGPVVDEAALLKAMRERDVRCGLDVFCDEPSGGQTEFECALIAQEQCYGTHHIGASTAQAQEAVASEAARVVLTWKQQGIVPNCVNVNASPAASHVLVVRHRDEVGVLASVFDVLRAASLNVQEMENTIFTGGHAAVARIRVEGCPETSTLEAIAQAPNILAVNVVEASTPC